MGVETGRTNADLAEREGAIRVPGLRGVRYGEVLLLHAADGRFRAEVWNTMALNDCPQELWDGLDAAAIAAERGALLAILNGPRHWLIDAITSTGILDGKPTTEFAGLGMSLVADVDFGTEPPEMGPYIERHVERETLFELDAGRDVHELVAPDGTTYVMQAYCLAADPTLTEDRLAGLADRLALPDGWAFRTRTLTEPIALVSVDGVATVIQDELQNTYQRDDR